MEFSVRFTTLTAQKSSGRDHIIRTILGLSSLDAQFSLEMARSTVSHYPMAASCFVPTSSSPVCGQASNVFRPQNISWTMFLVHHALVHILSCSFRMHSLEFSITDLQQSCPVCPQDLQHSVCLCNNLQFSPLAVFLANLGCLPEVHLVAPCVLSQVLAFTSFHCAIILVYLLQWLVAALNNYDPP